MAKRENWPCESVYFEENIMKYLYVIHIQVFEKAGRLFMERAAALDFQAHQRLLPKYVHMVLAAPVSPLDSSGVSPVSLEEIKDTECIHLHYVDGLLDGISAFRTNWRKLTEAVSAADFVHTGCGGFPFFFSPCYLAFRLALKMNKKVLFVMDCDLVGKLEMDQVHLTKNPLKKSIWYLFSKICWRMYTQCLSKASATFLLGRGVVSRYGRYANNWLEIYQPIVGQDMIIPLADLQQKIKSLNSDINLKICFAGRLAPEKGVEVMLRALSALTNRFQFSVNIYGDGPYRAEYMELAEKLNLKDMVIFHGNREWGEDLFGELRKNHILIVPHLTLEMTRNVFDGMASGCAIIASDTKALAGLIDDSQAGVLFKTGDHHALAHVLASQLIKPSEIITSITNGVNFVQKNNRDSHVQRRLDFLTKKLALRF